MTAWQVYQTVQMTVARADGQLVKTPHQTTTPLVVVTLYMPAAESQGAHQ
jgi:hypothetical protein